MLENRSLGLCNAALLAALLAGTCQVAFAQSVVSTRVLGPFAGALARPQSNIGMQGTDLGYSVKDGSRLRFFFGDTFADATGTPVGASNDDVRGDISLTLFPTGASVESFVQANPPLAGQLSWQRATPPLAFPTAAGKVTAITVYRGGATALSMGTYQVPASAFSNARSTIFGIFWRNTLQQCSGGFFPSCGGDLACDTGLGMCAGSDPSAPAPCALGTVRCLCLPMASGGFCEDPTTSVWSPTEDGRVLSIAQVLEVGAADTSTPATQDRFASKPWSTAKFANIVTQTVDDFDPNRVNGSGNVYRPADGINVSTEKVLIWGRPGQAASKINGRTLSLYFAYTDMPSYDAKGNFAWSPKYFSGLVNGKPTFSSRQVDAVPLNLSSPWGGTFESQDIVAQMSVTWVESVKKWVMFYGGDWPSGALLAYNGIWDGPFIQRDPNGAVMARFADQPWGPWTAPVPVLKAGDPAVYPPIPGTQYALGGMLYHPGCIGSDCAPPQSTIYTILPGSVEGRLYGVNIIDEWTAEQGGGVVDLYWNVSTWSPYQVSLMTTRVQF